MINRRHLAYALTGVVLLALCGKASAQAYPDKPIRVIVPSAAGGSTDLVARILQLTLERTKGLPQPLAVVNNAAAGGVVGTRMIKDAEPDGHTIGVWHMGLLTAHAMGVTDYDHTAFEPLAQVGRIQVGLGVREDSRFKSAKDLIEVAKAQPNTVTFATNIGLLPHFVPLMLASETGTSFRFVQAGGGSLRLKSLLGGHTEVTLFSLTELMAFKANGVRPLFLFADARNPAAPDIPALTESGYQTAFDERILVLAPKGTPADRMAVLVNALKAAMQDPDLVKRFEEQGIERLFVEGAALKTQLDEASARVQRVAAEVKKETAAKN